ncbi:beta-galactosidase [Bacteroidia bacterium]|nr:beta-galactosidase [Bacteroidia bacterium]GHT62535.1 beta-galactosidase [Bacteroidia bacterium]
MVSRKHIATFLFILFPILCFAGQDERIRSNFDFDWKFRLGESSGAIQPEYDDADWQNIQLPHDWSIEMPVERKNGGSMGFFPGGTGWYRKTFEVPADYKNKKVTILFDGVYHQSDVYINGVHLGFHPYGYTGFEYDLSPYLKFGEKNTLTVRVDHSNAPSSRWYSGSGIYRHVWLTATHPVHLSTWGTSITTPRITSEEADIRIVTSIENNTDKEKTVSLESRIKDAKGKIVASAVAKIAIEKETAKNPEQVLSLPHPILWSPDSPYLYSVESIVKINGKAIDRYETPVGIRQIRTDPDKGFFLNGKNLKMKGMNLHQDAGPLGTAVPDRSYERRLEILKEYGCNAIRCSHNPPSPEFLDICDRLGFLVIDEAFDKWKSGYYEKYFDEWWQKDLGDMLRRDRNHPSIVLWSIGNEVKEQDDSTSTGMERAKMLQDYVHQIEPTRPVTAAIAPGNLMLSPYNKSGFSDVLDIVGYNYQEPRYQDDHKLYPKRIFFGSEVFPFYRGRKNFTRDYSPVNPWYDINNDFLFGQFIWAGVDYLGESSGFPSKGWPTCPFNSCMFEKAFGAFYRAVWNDQPMVSIAVADQSLDIDPGKDHWSLPPLISHWTFPQYKGHVIQVQTITNCESVELWVNGMSFGRRNTFDYPNNTIVWYVPYKEGKIEAKAYNQDNEVADFSLQTAGKPVKIVLTADKETLQSDGQDLAHITVSLVDENGITVPNADVPVTFEITGNGQLAGLDNGDLRNHEPYKGTTCTTYFGTLLAIVQSHRIPGEITVKAGAPGLTETQIQLKNYNEYNLYKR